MNNQPQPAIRSGEKIPYLDATNDHLMFTREFWNKVIAAANALLQSRDCQVTENGILFNFTSSSGGGSTIRGEWDPAPPDGPYKAGDVVFFTPDGESAAAFYALLDVPGGLSPDTAAPYWASWPNAPAGLWA